MKGVSLVVTTVLFAWVLFEAAPVLPAQTAGLTVVRGDYDMRKVITPPQLTEIELKGRLLFFGRCSVCHVRGVGPWVDQQTVKALGEANVREMIAKGSPGMPGQQYSLSAAQIDQIVDFLKRVTPDQKPTKVPGFW
jgi:mono/diheme cytochrome c family protein